MRVVLPGGGVGGGDELKVPGIGPFGGARAQGLPSQVKGGEEPLPVFSAKPRFSEGGPVAGASEITYSGVMTRAHFIASPPSLSSVSRPRGVMGSWLGAGGATASLLISKFKGTT